MSAAAGWEEIVTDERCEEREWVSVCEEDHTCWIINKERRREWEQQKNQRKALP